MAPRRVRSPAVRSPQLAGMFFRRVARFEVSAYLSAVLHKERRHARIKVA